MSATGRMIPTDGASVNQVARALEPMIDSRPETAPEPATESPIPEPAAPPESTAAPADSPEGRLLAGYISVADVEALRSRDPTIADDPRYRRLRAVAEVADLERSDAQAELQRQREQWHAHAPEMADPDSRQRLADELEAHVKQFDFQPQDLYAVTDARALRLARHSLRASQRVRELERENAALRAGTHPSSPREDREPRAPARARRGEAELKQLETSHTMRAAKRALEAMLGD